MREKIKKYIEQKCLYSYGLIESDAQHMDDIMFNILAVFSINTLVSTFNYTICCGCVITFDNCQNLIQLQNSGRGECLARSLC